jgi:hypothetical protein
MSQLAAKGLLLWFEKSLTFQCLFESAELPCKLCEQRGFLCGAKIFGPKTQSKTEDTVDKIQKNQSTEPFPLHVSTLHDQVLSPLEKQFILFFFQTASHSSVFTFQPSLAAKDGPILPAHRAKVLISSNALRYAILAYVSNSKLGREGNIKTLQYIGQCYRSIHEAIATSGVVDTVYACYILIVLAFEMQDPTEMIVTHLVGVCQGVKVVQSTSMLLGTREFLWIERLWQNILHRIYHRLQQICHDPCTLAPQVKRIYEILQGSQSFMLCHSGTLAGDTWKKQKVQRFHSLGIHFQFCFIHYLLQTSFGVDDRTDADRLTASLGQILRQLINAALEIDSPLFARDVQTLSQFTLDSYIRPGSSQTILVEARMNYDITLSLYFSSIIIHGLLFSEPNWALKSAAVLLCQIVVLRGDKHPPGSLFEIRNLFMAGLILTTDSYPRGSPTFVGF